MDNFDFEKVHRVMKLLNWKWALDNDTPSIPQLRKHVRDQMSRIYGTNIFRIESGGFVTTYRFGTDQDGEWDYFDVAFVLTSWESIDA